MRQLPESRIAYRKSLEKIVRSIPGPIITKKEITIVGPPVTANYRRYKEEIPRGSLKATLRERYSKRFPGATIDLSRIK